MHSDPHTTLQQTTASPNEVICDILGLNCWVGTIHAYHCAYDKPSDHGYYEFGQLSFSLYVMVLNMFVVVTCGRSHAIELYRLAQHGN
jgi:hypothetical protein